MIDEGCDRWPEGADDSTGNRTKVKLTQIIIVYAGIEPRAWWGIGQKENRNFFLNKSSCKKYKDRTSDSEWIKWVTSDQCS